jgi:hypothetical protein
MAAPVSLQAWSLHLPLQCLPYLPVTPPSGGDCLYRIQPQNAIDRAATTAYAAMLGHAAARQRK